MKTPQPTPRPRAVLYSRLSRATLESTSLAGQSEDLDAVAEREGWDVVATFVDEGLSGGKRRANADEALRMLRENEADVLAAYAVDRFSRMGIGEDAEVIRTVEVRERQAQRGLTPAPLVYFAREGIRSDSGSDWRLRYALSSEMARGERDVMVSRRKRSIEQLQNSGRFTGRGPAPWGYRAADHPSGAGRILVPDPIEAATVREVARRLIAGESGSAVARDMVKRHVPAPRSEARLALLRGEDPAGLATGLWSSSNLAQMMQSQHLLGRIARATNRSEAGATRQGIPVIGADGQPLQAFDPILDLPTFLALQDRFARGMGRGQQRLRKAARIGSGLIFCAECGSKCYVSSSRDNVAYRCSSGARGALTTCRGRRVKAEIAEAVIEAEYLSIRGDLPAIELRIADNYVDEVIASLTERIRAIGRQITQPGADVVGLSTELVGLQRERDEAMSAPATPDAEYIDLGQTWREVWATATVDERRHYLAQVFERFELLSADAAQRVLPVLVSMPTTSHLTSGRGPEDDDRYLADDAG